MIPRSVIITGLIGVASGVAGYFLGLTRARKAEETRLAMEGELKRDLDFYYELNEKLAIENMELVTKVDNYISQFGELDEESPDVEVPDELPEIGKPSYGSLVRAKPSLDSLVNRYHLGGIDLSPEDIPPTENRPSGPYIVPEEEVSPEDTEIIQLEYFPLDGVLVDDRMTAIAEPVRVTGVSAWTQMSTMKGSAVFIRHDDRNIVYEIAINHGLSYRQDVMGLDPIDE